MQGLRSEKQRCECKARFTASAKVLGSDWTWGMEEDKVLGGSGRSDRGEVGSTQPPASQFLKTRGQGSERFMRLPVWVKLRILRVPGGPL